MKIIRQTGVDTFEVRMEDHDIVHYPYPRLDKLVVAHDYVMFTVMGSIFTEGDVQLNKNSPHVVCNNVVSVEKQVQIGIREFQDIILPILNNHEFLQPKHLAKRDDGTYGYVSNAAVLYKENGITMVSFREEGEVGYSTVTLKTYNELIKPAMLLRYEQNTKTKDKKYE